MRRVFALLIVLFCLIVVFPTLAQEEEFRDRGLFEGLAAAPLYEHRWGKLSRFRLRAPGENE